MSSKKEIVIVLSNDITTIHQLVAEGFCPVECSIGGESIVDSLQMDHHGSLSHLEAVSVRAYRDLFGERASDPRFVMTGVADADAAFCAAALAGIIPHSRRELPPNVSAEVKASLTRDLTLLAETIALVDTNPIGLNIPELPFGSVLLTWNGMVCSARDTLGAYGAVAMWRNLLDGHPRATS